VKHLFNPSWHGGVPYQKLKKCKVYEKEKMCNTSLTSETKKVKFMRRGVNIVQCECIYCVPQCVCTSVDMFVQ
jgi:hypothetical protein